MQACVLEMFHENNSTVLFHNTTKIKGGSHVAHHPNYVRKIPLRSLLVGVI